MRFSKEDFNNQIIIQQTTKNDFPSFSLFASTWGQSQEKDIIMKCPVPEYYFDNVKLFLFFNIVRCFNIGCLLFKNTSKD